MQLSMFSIVGALSLPILAAPEKRQDQNKLRIGLYPTDTCETTEDQQQYSETNADESHVLCGSPDERVGPRLSFNIVEVPSMINDKPDGCVIRKFSGPGCSGDHVGDVPYTTDCQTNDFSGDVQSFLIDCSVLYGEDGPENDEPSQTLDMDWTFVTEAV